MSREHYELLDAMQYADEQMVFQAGQPWKAKKKTFRIPSGVWAAGIAVAVLAGVFGVFGEQAVAAIREFTTRISEIIENRRDLQPYTKVLNQTQTKDGVSMTLEEVVLDSNRILVTVEAFSDTPVVIDENGLSNQWSMLNSVKINGEYVENIMDSQYVTDNPNECVLVYSVEEGAIPQEISEVELLIDYGIKNEEGLWESTTDFTYSFTATEQELMLQSTVLPVDADVDAGDGLVFHIEDMTYTDISGRIRLTCSREPGRWTEEDGYRYYELPYYYSLDIEDDQGNCMSFDVLENSYEEETRTLTCDSFIGTPPAEDAEYLDISVVRFESVTIADLEAEESDIETEDIFPEEEVTGKVRVDLKQ